MTLLLMRRLDRWIGGLLIFLAGLWPRRPRAAPAAPREIVIVKLMGLGSLLTCAGVWRVLRQRHPQARITVVSLAGTAAAARLLPEVDEVFSLSTQGVRSLCRDGWRVWRALRRRRPDVMVDIEYFSNLCALFCALCGARYRLGFLSHPAELRAGDGESFHHEGHEGGGGRCQVVGGRAGPPDPPQRPDGERESIHHDGHEGRLARDRWFDSGVILREDLHFRDNVVRLLAPLGVSTTAPLPVVTLTLPDEVRQEAARLLAGAAQGWIAINPHASELCRQRRWPLERFAQVAGALLARDPSLGIVIPGTADERPRAEALCAQLSPEDQPRVRILAGQTSLPVLAGVLQQCRLVLTADTGVMHLAAAVGTPLVALFGPEAPVRYAPAGDPRRTVVLAGTAPCAPCLCGANRKQAPCTADPAACMLALSVADVQRACERLLPG